MCPPRGEPNRPTGPAAPRARAPGSGHLLGVASVQGQSPPQPRGAARQVRRQRSSAGALAPSGGHVLGQQPSALPSFHSWTQTPRPTRLLRPETGGPGPSAPIRPGPQPEIQDLPGLAHSPLRQVRFLDTRMQQGRNGLRGSGKQEDVGTSGRKEHRHRLSRPSTPAPTAPHPPPPTPTKIPPPRPHARTHARPALTTKGPALRKANAMPACLGKQKQRNKPKTARPRVTADNPGPGVLPPTTTKAALGPQTALQSLQACHLPTRQEGKRRGAGRTLSLVSVEALWATGREARVPKCKCLGTSPGSLHAATSRWASQPGDRAPWHLRAGDGCDRDPRPSSASHGTGPAPNRAWGSCQRDPLTPLPLRTEVRCNRG